ncbi:b78150ae-192f-466b-b7d0-5fa685c664d5 [Thermothielavioides terrestris]|uniref:B78150ae-192f-466b-b7d0-5fa685c664d5 n=1 Tax=Thermothielavioides terrestris TaxID=2587410 RepID=A0A446BM46_9PEZI|nr:b78150ae-192f-466b-b7d0-5fa685c664d5 [Thermothielavioides terrestris]
MASKNDTVNKRAAEPEWKVAYVLLDYAFPSLRNRLRRAIAPFTTMALPTTVAPPAVAAAPTTAVAPAEQHGEFERSTYIDGARRVLSGLPRDLDPDDAAILCRAMPPALADAAAATAAAAAAAAAAGGGGGGGARERSRGGKQQGPAMTGGGYGYGDGDGGGGDDVNVVHWLALCFLRWLYTVGSWLAPRLAVFGAQLVQAEQQHQYIPHLLLAAERLLRATCVALRWLSGTFPVRNLVAVLEYVAEGLRRA